MLHWLLGGGSGIGASLAPLRAALSVQHRLHWGQQYRCSNGFYGAQHRRSMGSCWGSSIGASLTLAGRQRRCITGFCGSKFRGSSIGAPLAPAGTAALAQHRLLRVLCRLAVASTIDEVVGQRIGVVGTLTTYPMADVDALQLISVCDWFKCTHTSVLLAPTATRVTEKWVCCPLVLVPLTDWGRSTVLSISSYFLALLCI